MSTEPDIIEALTELAEAKVGDPMPKCLIGENQWGAVLSEIARRARDEILDLRKACDVYEGKR